MKFNLRCVTYLAVFLVISYSFITAGIGGGSLAGSPDFSLPLALASTLLGFFFTAEYLFPRRYYVYSTVFGGNRDLPVA